MQLFINFYNKFDVLTKGHLNLKETSNVREYLIGIYLLDVKVKLSKFKLCEV
jgi:hypothetical protein